MNGMIAFFSLIVVSVIILFVYLTSKSNILKNNPEEKKKEEKKLHKADDYILKIIINWFMILGILGLGSMVYIAKLLINNS